MGLYLCLLLLVYLSFKHIYKVAIDKHKLLTCSELRQAHSTHFLDTVIDRLNNDHVRIIELIMSSVTDCDVQSETEFEDIMQSIDAFFLNLEATRSHIEQRNESMLNCKRNRDSVTKTVTLIQRIFADGCSTFDLFDGPKLAVYTNRLGFKGYNCSLNSELAIYSISALRRAALYRCESKNPYLETGLTAALSEIVKWPSLGVHSLQRDTFLLHELLLSKDTPEMNLTDTSWYAKGYLSHNLFGMMNEDIERYTTFSSFDKITRSPRKRLLHKMRYLILILVKRYPKLYYSDHVSPIILGINSLSQIIKISFHFPNIANQKLITSQAALVSDAFKRSGIDDELITVWTLIEFDHILANFYTN